MEKRNVPKLRFKGFEDAWKECKLGEIADVTKLAGFEFTKYVEYSDSGQKIAIRGLNVKNGKLNLEDVKYIDNSNFSKLNRSKLYINDLLLTYVGTIGDLAIINENDKYYLAPNVCRIRILNHNSNFIKHLMSSNRFYHTVMIPSITTSSQPAMSMESIRAFKMQIPKLGEQTKIANFLSNVDNIIEEQEGKVKDLEQYKKGMMQKIFEQEVRFKDENGEEYPEWEEKWFSEILIEDLYPVKKPNKPYEKLSVRSHAKGTFSSLVEKPEEVAMDTLYEVKANQLIVNITFAWEHAIAIVNKEDEGKLVSHRFPTYKFSNNSNYKFYRYVITQKIIKYKLGLASPGGAGRNRVLNKKEFLKIEVPNPCLQEQTKIANFLSNIDNIIEEENKKLEDLKLWKKGLLQQMFV
ncbi:restriction endonuclease subunit S [Clostridium baratii]|uniref:restriction endonuclease subunit S n=1 Tax=Clostridium baratii TaxID=1561 RepID=UPI001C02A3FA